MVTQTTTLTGTPGELRQKFFALQTPEDISALLEIDHHQQIYHLYMVPESKKYKTFYIPKRRGGVREICSPITPLKIMQRKLNQVLMAVYRPKRPVHGFVNKRDIMTNAGPHVARRYVFNIDL
jgi:RNA-directed DNA polymerase